MAWASVNPAGTPQASARTMISRRERPRLVGAAGCTTVTREVYNDRPMSSVASPQAPPTPNWSRLVTDSIKQHGMWHTYHKLSEARAAYPDDLSLRGYTEILRNNIVRDFVAHPKGMQLMPKLSAEFLTNFDRFNLNAQEGYLVSLIDGRMDLQKLLILSPFDPFNTMFTLAKLENERAITVPQ